MVYLTTREAMLRSTFFGQLLLTMAMSVRARALHCGALRGGARERNWQWARLPPPTFVVFSAPLPLLASLARRSNFGVNFGLAWASYSNLGKRGCVGARAARACARSAHLAGAARLRSPRRLHSAGPVLLLQPRVLELAVGGDLEVVV
jgi:hypothetical protein